LIHFYKSFQMKMVEEETPKETEPSKDGEEGMDDESGSYNDENEADMLHQPDIDLEQLDEEERAEFNELNRQLDELDQVLDSLEHKNDLIHSQLKELLADSRQAREEMQKSGEIDC